MTLKSQASWMIRVTISRPHFAPCVSTGGFRIKCLAKRHHQLLIISSNLKTSETKLHPKKVFLSLKNHSENQLILLKFLFL
jgi:hypothetical protein